MAKLRVGIEDLVRFREGDQGAFEAVVRAYSKTVWSVVSRFWASPFEQEEAMQEVWFKVYRQREALDPDRFEQFSAWLAVLTRRSCIDLVRKQGRRPNLAHDAQEEEDFGADPPDQEEAARNAEVLAAVEAFRQRLEADWRIFFDLHFGQGLELAAVADRLGVRKSRCKYMKRVLVGRARRNPGLRSVLDPGPGGGGSDAPES